MCYMTTLAAYHNPLGAWCRPALMPRLASQDRLRQYLMTFYTLSWSPSRKEGLPLPPTLVQSSLSLNRIEA